MYIIDSYSGVAEKSESDSSESNSDDEVEIDEFMQNVKELAPAK
jgi:hypothetical protein